MQTAKSFSTEPPAPAFSRVAAHSGASAARRAKRLAALKTLAPQLDALSSESKDAGLGLIGYFLDMALFEVKRELDLQAEKA